MSSSSYMHHFETSKWAHSLNLSRSSVAALTASSTFDGCVPVPIATGALPPALPPTSFETAADQSAGLSPA